MRIWWAVARAVPGPPWGGTAEPAGGTPAPEGGPGPVPAALLQEVEALQLEVAGLRGGVGDLQRPAHRHLDPRRRSELLAVLADLGAQSWLTGTEARLFDVLTRTGQFFHVADGALTPHD